jgi:hypothetical protein
MAANKSRKLAQSASALGAGLLGFGIGAKWGFGISSVILTVALFIGGFIHIAGMYVVQIKNQKKADTVAKILWFSAWICLLALAGLFVYLAFA